MKIYNFKMVCFAAVVLAVISLNVYNIFWN
jgi:hypothetical protein